jgi:ApbE superfamily uncharacterized protein (UPF0280 family)
METNRFYRESFKAGNLKYFQAASGQTDLFIGAETDLSEEALNAVVHYRSELEGYIRRHPEFLHSLVPVTPASDAPMIVRDMCAAADLAGVGPMAAVAGAVAKHVGCELLRMSREIIVENGGDIFIHSLSDRKIGIYAGNSPLSGKLAVLVRKKDFPCGICTSSGTVGHSLSFGKADAAVIIAPDASLADACATALGNRVRTADDIEEALGFARSVPGVTGALVIIGDALGAWGSIELAEA